MAMRFSDRVFDDADLADLVNGAEYRSCGFDGLSLADVELEEVRTRRFGLLGNDDFGPVHRTIMVTGWTA